MVQYVAQPCPLGSTTPTTVAVSSDGSLIAVCAGNAVLLYNKEVCMFACIVNNRILYARVCCSDILVCCTCFAHCFLDVRRVISLPLKCDDLQMLYE